MSADSIILDLNLKSDDHMYTNGSWSDVRLDVKLVSNLFTLSDIMNYLFIAVSFEF
jgi:hypothetical protein